MVEEEPPHRGSDESKIAVTIPNGKIVEARHLLDRLPVAAYLCDPSGLITYYNQRARELWGRAPKLNDPGERFCGWFRFYSTEDGSPLGHDHSWMALALRAQKEYNNRELVIERPDGERRTVLANANPIWNDSGELIGAINVLTDITERKRAEEECLQLREALLKRGRLNFAEEIAAGITHELSQPLTAILTYSEACTALLDSGEADIAALVSAHEQIAKLGKRVAGILRYLRGLLSKTPLQQEAVDLPVLVRETVNYISAASGHGEQSARMRVEVPESLPRIKADPIQIQLVLVNLMRNSLEAMSDPGVERRELTVTGEPGPDNMVTVTVRDTGRGFDEELQELLVYPFFTTKSESIGLGLPVAVSIIEAHGGRLWATREHEAGTTSFHFTVPRAGERDADEAGGTGK